MSSSDLTNNDDLKQCSASFECPTPSAHVRLSDVHYFWHQMESSYCHPEIFRIHLNACIQEIRNVTFVLQKDKHLIPDFDRWYAPWQERMRNDKIMRWIVSARNRIVKQGDLETRSMIAVSIHDNWMTPPKMSFSVSPFTDTEEIAVDIASRDIPDSLRRDGLLRVERSWIANDLPDRDLLDVLAYAYGFLSMLIEDAHLHVGLGESNIIRLTHNGKVETIQKHKSDGVYKLPCMIDTSESRTVWVRLKTNEIIDIVSKHSTVDPKGEHTIKKRYGIKEFKKNRPEKLKEYAYYFFDIAKKIMPKDGFHLTMVMLFTESGRCIPISFNPIDRSEKYLQWEMVANRVKHTGATSLIAISEAWTVQLSEGMPYVHASDSPHRKEVLNLIAADISGVEISLTSEIIRKRKKMRKTITLGDTQEATGSFINILLPVKRVWETMRADIGT